MEHFTMLFLNCQFICIYVLSLYWSLLYVNTHTHICIYIYIMHIYIFVFLLQFWDFGVLKIAIFHILLKYPLDLLIDCVAYNHSQNWSAKTFYLLAKSFLWLFLPMIFFFRCRIPIKISIYYIFLFMYLFE